MTEQAYLSVDELAKRFGINATTVYRLTQRGRLPGFKVGSQWRFSPAILERWIASQLSLTRGKTRGRNRTSDRHTGQC